MGEGTVLLRRRALGDVLLLGAIASGVEGPVTVVTEARYCGIAARLEGVDRVLPWGSPVPEGRVLDLHGNKRSIARRVRAFLGVGPGRPAVADLYADVAGVERARLPWIHLDPEGPTETLALFPAAASPLKQYSGFAAVGRRWEGPVVVLGGPGEGALCEGVAAEIPGATWLVEEGFEETLRVLSRAAVALTCDSGPMHLAGAGGIPVVAVFGPTHPQDGFFCYQGEAVQREDLGCRPCTLHRRRRCPLGDRRCLDIDPDRVWDAVRRRQETSAPA